MSDIEIKVKIDGIEYTQDQLKDLAKGAKKAASEIDDVKKETKDAAKEQGFFSKKIDEVKEKFSGLKAGFGDLKKGYKTLQNGLTGMAKGFGLSSKAAKIFGTTTSAAIAATGIGLIVPLVLALVNYFSNLEAGAKILKKTMAALGAIISNVGTALKLLLSGDIAGAFNTMKDAVVEATEAVDSQFEAEKKLAQLRNKTIIENAKLNATIEENKKVLEDTTLSLDERLAALDGVTAATKKLAENQVAETKLALQSAEAQLILTNNYEERREKQLEIAELQASLIDQQTTLANVEYDANKVAREIRTQAAEEYKAQIEERMAMEQTVADALRDLNVNGIADEEAKAMAVLQIQQETQRQVLVDNKATKAQLLEADKLYEDQKIALEQSYRDKEAEAKAMQDEKDAADLLAKQERLKAILDQAYFESIENEFQRAQEELLRQEEQAMAELELLGATELEKQKIRDGYAKKRGKLAKEEASYNKKLAQDVTDNDLELATSAFSAIASLVGQESAAGKAAAVAAATISTYLGAQKAYTSQMTLTPDSPIRAALAAGVAIATGVANIRAIVATPTPGGGGGGGGAGGGLPSAGSIPTFTGNTGSLGLGEGPSVGDSDAIGDLSTTNSQGQPSTQPILKAYVVATEMTDAQEANARVENIAKL
jgi:hypothetical protein